MEECHQRGLGHEVFAADGCRPPKTKRVTRMLAGPKQFKQSCKPCSCGLELGEQVRMATSCMKLSGGTPFSQPLSGEQLNEEGIEFVKTLPCPPAGDDGSRKHGRGRGRS